MARGFISPCRTPFPLWTRNHLLSPEKNHLRREESNRSPTSHVICLRAKDRPRCRPSPSQRRSNRWPPGTPLPEHPGHRSRAKLLRRPAPGLSPRRNNPRVERNGLPARRSFGPAVHLRYLLANPRQFRLNPLATRNGLPLRHSLGPAVLRRYLLANPRQFRLNPLAAHSGPRSGLPLRRNISSVRAKPSLRSSRSRSGKCRGAESSQSPVNQSLFPHSRRAKAKLRFSPGCSHPRGRLPWGHRHLKPGPRSPWPDPRSRVSPPFPEMAWSCG